MVGRDGRGQPPMVGTAYPPMVGVGPVNGRVMVGMMVGFFRHK